MSEKKQPQINPEESSESRSNVTTGEDTKPLQVSEDQWKGYVRDYVEEEIQKEVKFDKASLFTVFGIFAAIVTFISIEIQLLRTLCGFWSVVGFSIIILTSLLTFILVLDYIGRGWRNDFKSEIKQFPWILLIIILLLFIAGFSSVSFSEKESECREEAIFRRYERDFAEKQLQLERKYDEEISNLNQELQNLKKKNQQRVQ